MKKRKSKAYKQFCKLLASTENVRESDLLIQDLLTPQETEILIERWQIIQELAKGTPQRKIAKKLNISISTVTRGSTALKYGPQGFIYFLKKLHIL